MKLTKDLAKKFQVDVTYLPHLEQYEQMGWDVSEWKPAALEKAGQQAEQAANQALARKEARSAFEQAHPVNLDRLAPYINTPRDAGSEFVSDAVGRVLFGKDKKCKAMAEVPLVYGAVVQANDALWDPGEGSFLPAVLVIATDAAYKNDIAWLKQTADAIGNLKRQGDIPPDMQKLIQALRSDTSSFCFKIGASIAGPADAWCATFKFEHQRDLPYKRIPQSGLLPFLLTEYPRENQFIQLKPVPAKYYAD
jgi:hypothetical protein